MRNVSSAFKTQVKKLGREIDIIITHGQETIGSNNVFYLNYSYDGALMKSVMKKLEIDISSDIDLNEEINLQIGIKVNGSYEYIDYGNFIVYSSEKQEDTDSYKLICYDKLLNAMKPYRDIDYTIDQTTYTFPMTLNDYIKFISAKIGLPFYDYNNEYPNFNKIIESDPYVDAEGKDLGYTYRDILDDIAEATAGIVCIQREENIDYLEIRYLNITTERIDENNLKDIKVTFGEKYGAINSVVLSRSAESDNVYRKYEEAIERDGLYEIKIIDNQIMNGNDRSEYLNAILIALYSLDPASITSQGRSFYLNDYSSTGFLYLDLFDFYTIRIGNQNYRTIMLSDEIIIDQGLEENIYTQKPEQGETEYSKADTTDRRINQAYLMVDKQQGEILGYVGEFSEYKKTNKEQVDRIEDIASGSQATLFELTKEGGKLESMEKQITDAGSKVVNSVVTINIDGINVSTNQSAISTLINNEKLVIMNGGIPLAFFGYDSEDQTTKSYVEHLTVNTYFIAGYHRIEKFEPSGEERTGWFYIG